MLAVADSISFSDWLGSQLNTQGITQAELARRAGVTRSAINGILSGARGPGIELCMGIARALKLPPEEVYRAAGLLPPEPSKDTTLKRIEILYQTLDEPSSKDRALEYLEFLTQQEEKDDRKRKKP